MKQVLSTLSTVAPSTSSVNYSPISRFGGWAGGETGLHQVWPVAGSFANLVVRLSVAPGAGKSYAYVVRINGVDTALTCTISDANLTARDITHSVAIAAGDLVTVKSTPTGTPTTPGATGVHVTIEFTSTTPKESGYGGPPVAVSGGAASTKYAPPFSGGGWTTTAAEATEIIPCAGTITALYLRTVSITGANTDTVTIYLNGVKQDGTAGTPNTTVDLVAGNVQDVTTFSLPVVAGDKIYLEIVKVGTGFELIGHSTRFVAAVDGQSIHAGGTSDLTDTSQAYYHHAGFSGSAVAWVVTEASMGADCGVNSFSLSKLRVLLSAAPGVGKSYTFSIRVNAASPANTPSVTISDANVTGTDSNGIATLVDTNIFNIRNVPSGTPTGVVAHWAMIQTVGGAHGNSGKGNSAGKKGGGAGVSAYVPGGASMLNIGNTIDIGSGS